MLIDILHVKETLDQGRFSGIFPYMKQFSFALKSPRWTEQVYLNVPASQSYIAYDGWSIDFTVLGALEVIYYR